MPYADPRAASDRARWRYHNDPEYRAKKRAYYARNRDRIIANAKRRANPETKAAYDREHNRCDDVRARKARQRREWERRNPTKAAAHNRARSLARRNARPDKPAKEYIAILLQDPCAYCGAPMEHVDHIIPLAAGGDSSWENLTAACKACNHAKRADSLLSHLLRK